FFTADCTQSLRPVSLKWVASGFIHTCDPYIFFFHVAGIVGWVLGTEPGPTFLLMYGIIALYYIKRYFDKREITKKIREVFPETELIATSPTMKQNHWRVAITTTNRF